MGKTYFGIDNEFGASTGSNVNSGGSTSDFDFPPSSSTNLVVTSADDDATPYIFEPGETYDVSWTNGEGDPVVLEDATVVRSDVLGSDSGVVVFEGLDENGDLAQIVWSPGFDLEQWYFDNFTGGGADDGGLPPQFYTTDQQASQTYSVVCFAAGTRVDLPRGSTPVEHLRVGASIKDLDYGRAKVRWIGQSTVPGMGAGAPVRFAPGAFGNDVPLLVSQQHRILVTSPLAELYFGAAEVLVPARALVGSPGVDLAPCRSIDYIHVYLPRHGLLQAAGGTPCESLYLGDMAAAAMRGFHALAHRADPATLQLARPALGLREGRFLAQQIQSGMVAPPLKRTARSGCADARDCPVGGPWPGRKPSGYCPA